MLSNQAAHLAKMDSAFFVVLVGFVCFKIHIVVLHILDDSFIKQFICMTAYSIISTLT